MSYGRTGLILRQWVERDGCTVTAYQAESYETHTIMTSITDKVRIFVFPNEWRAMLCEARMSTYGKMRERNWKRYFDLPITKPLLVNTFNVPFPDSVPYTLTVLAILIILAVYLS